MSEAPGETVNSSNRDLHSDFNHVSGPENNPSNEDAPNLSHSHRKAETTHAPVPFLGVSSDNLNSADLDTINSSTNHSSDSKSPGNSQSSRLRSHLKEGSVRHTPSEEWVAEALGIPKDGPSNDKGGTYYARYRQSGADLMTKHMFSGKKVGKRISYIPVYKRNRHGKLFKLKETRLRHWRYTEVSELSEEEIEGGLKIMEEPETDVVL